MELVGMEYVAAKSRNRSTTLLVFQDHQIQTKFPQLSSEGIENVFSSEKRSNVNNLQMFSLVLTNSTFNNITNPTRTTIPPQNQTASR